MERMACFIVLLSALFVSSANFVEGNQDCSSCYQLDIGVAVGIITCDIFLTLFIAVSVYCFVSHKNSRACSHTQARCCGSSSQNNNPPVINETKDDRSGIALPGALWSTVRYIQ
ncbi:TYRO protein tyrosine kinase-binding protein isoform X2 [Paramisgurnus dabryanus]|uniref:TYRO protein tyrosine kinase-binding protein isoform X2 n=1 Tax=Paramisgurnus dabryanus TaxID=90735 RepID=UPI0031F408CD